MDGFYTLVLVPQDRSPELVFVDLCSIFQAGAVGNSPGPNFGRKPAPKRPKLKSIFELPNLSLRRALKRERARAISLFGGLSQRRFDNAANKKTNPILCHAIVLPV